MTTRTTRNTRESSSAQYEDFQPKFDWKEEAAANILKIYLPGFSKEQLRITYVHSSRIVRVTGERPLANNKWSRFNQAFPVPENCEVSKIQGKFQNEMLVITMPKATARPVAPPKEKTAPATKAASKPAPPASPSGATTSQTPPKAAPGDAKTQMGLADTSRDALTSARTESQKQEPSKKPGAFGPEEVSRDTKTKEKMPTSPTTEAAEKRITEQLKEKAKITLAELEESGGKKRKEPIPVELELDQDKKKWKEIPGDRDDQQRMRTKEFVTGDRVKGMGRNVASAAKRTVQGLKNINIGQLSEERSTMVNVGAAVLVLVAFGAYIYYSHGSSRDARD